MKIHIYTSKINWVCVFNWLTNKCKETCKTPNGHLKRFVVITFSWLRRKTRRRSYGHVRKILSTSIQTRLIKDLNTWNLNFSSSTSFWVMIWYCEFQASYLRMSRQFFALCMATANAGKVMCKQFTGLMKAKYMQPVGGSMGSLKFKSPNCR